MKLSIPSCSNRHATTVLGLSMLLGMCACAATAVDRNEPDVGAVDENDGRSESQSSQGQSNDNGGKIVLRKVSKDAGVNKPGTKPKPDAGIDAGPVVVDAGSVVVADAGQPDSGPGTLPAQDAGLSNADAGSSVDNSGLPSSCPGRCNSATPVYPTVDSNGGLGNVTMYTTEASNGGACLYGATSIKYFAAMSVNVVPGDNKGQWQGGKICGQCAEVTALTSTGPKSVVVRIMDKCPDGDCGIDLGGLAPATVMSDGYGRYDGKWRFVSCDGHPEVSDGVPSIYVALGSSIWWSRIQVRNPSWAIKSIDWKDTSNSANSGTLPFATEMENMYEVPVSQVLQSKGGPIKLTVNHVDGSSKSVVLTPSQLGTGGATYLLE